MVTKKPKEDESRIDTDGGAYIGGSVNTGGGTFVGRDLIQNITNYIFKGTEQRRALQNRQNMLKLVDKTWVKGVLEKSLHNEILIELGMETKLDAIEHPWDMVLQMPEREACSIPHSTKIIDTFDEMNGALLILGEPGSGKTTMLLELARQAIQRTEKDLTQPIPVVFNLSSWSDPKKSIDDWVVEEFKSKYYIGEDIARPWVENDELLFLLDGLDEVSIDCRDACVNAINEFSQKHFMPLAVCSRIADYEAMTGRLNLHGAILLQPLTPEQIKSYFEKVGIRPELIRKVFENDADFQEFVQSPLMLSTIALAYQDLTTQQLATTELVAVRRKMLFDAYIKNMFGRVARRKDERFPKEKALGQMNWLAQQMVKHKQSIFMLEKMKMSWLKTRWGRQAHILLVGTLVGILWGLLLGIIYGLTYGLELKVALIIGLIFVLSFGISGGLNTWLNTNLVDRFRFMPKDGLIAGLIRGLSGWAIFGPIIMAVIGLLKGPFDEINLSQSDALDWWLMFGLVFFLISALSSSFRDEPIETLEWSWAKAVKGLRTGFIFGFIIGVIFVLVVFPVFLVIPSFSTGELSLDTLSDLGFLIFMAMIFLCCLSPILGIIPFGLFFGLIGLPLGGIQGTKVETSNRPGQGIRSSTKSAIAGGLIVGLIGGALLGVFSAIIVPLSEQPYTLRLIFGPAILFGLNVGLGSALIRYGFGFIIYHFTLRFVLALSGSIPWRYIAFLDYATERIFLRQVGGGYIFIHRMLMEHFAELDDERIKTLAQEIVA